MELERYPMECRGVCGPGTQIQFAVEQGEHGMVVTPVLEFGVE
jgi:hypothetical protein